MDVKRHPPRTNDSSWKLSSLSVEGIPRPPNQRSDFRGEANMQKTVSRTYSNHLKWKQTRPSRARSQTRAWSTVRRPWRIRVSTWSFYRMAILSTTHSSSSSRWQPSSDLWSIWSWDSWKSSSWMEQWILLSLFQWCHFACRKFDLLAIDGRCQQLHVFHMHSCCTVILPQTSRTNFTHHAWLKNHGEHCQCLPTKHSHSIAQCRKSRCTWWHQARALLPHLSWILPSAGTNPAEIFGHSWVALWLSPWLFTIHLSQGESVLKSNVLTSTTDSYEESRLLTWSMTTFKPPELMMQLKACLDLFNICLQNDDVQDFDARWDQILLGTSEIPPENVLGRFVKNEVAGFRTTSKLCCLFITR